MEYNYKQLENIFEIGRIIQHAFHRGLIPDNCDSKELFNFAVRCSTKFEKEYPDTEDYYYDIENFVEEQIKNLNNCY